MRSDCPNRAVRFRTGYGDGCYGLQSSIVTWLVSLSPNDYEDGSWPSHTRIWPTALQVGSLVPHRLATPAQEWSRERALNPRPRDDQPRALPSELSLDGEIWCRMQESSPLSLLVRQLGSPRIFCDRVAGADISGCSLVRCCQPSSVS